MLNQSTTISTGTEISASTSSIFDLSVITTLCLFVLLLFNLTFTLYFYISWKKRLGIRRRQSTEEAETRPYNTCTSGIASTTSDHAYTGVGVRNSNCSYASYDTLDSRYCLNPVMSRGRRQSDKWKTLTTFFTLNAKDVQNILSKLETENESPV